MRYLTGLLAAGLLGCSGTRTEPPADVLAIQDYIAVAQLVEIEGLGQVLEGAAVIGGTFYFLSQIAAVFLQAIGGFLCVVDYRIPFFGGAAMAAISLLAVQFIRFNARHD